MSVEIDGILYFTADEVALRAGVSRQTLWRWRQDGNVPGVHKYRGTRLLFTEEEVQLVLDFAHRIEPAEIRKISGSGVSTA